MNRSALPYAYAIGVVLVGGCSDGTNDAPPGPTTDATSTDAADATDTAASDTGDANPADGGETGADSARADASSDADGDAGSDGASDGPTDADGGCGTGVGGVVKTVDASKALTIFDASTNDLRIDLTTDGAIALIEDSATGDLFFYDTVKGTLTKKAKIDGDLSTVGATSLSGDGTRIGGSHGATDILGGVWGCGAWSDVKNTHAKGCAGPPNNESGVFNLSGNGTVAVGLAWDLCNASAVMWTQTKDTWTATALAHLGIATGNNRATVVSDDGGVIGGFAQRSGADRSPAVWKSDGTGRLLEPTGDVVGEVLSISGDGKMVAGQWNSVTATGDALNTAFYWTEADGVQMIGTLPSPQAQDFVWPMAIAAKNKLILGSAGDPGWAFDVAGSEELAVAWTKAKGMRKLQDLVVAAKIAIPTGYDLTAISAASADGTVVLGVATDMNDPSLAQHTFVLRMPASAYGL